MTTPFDTKLKHMLNNHLSATGADHHILKAFMHELILTFEVFTDGCTVENIKTFQRDDGTNLVQAFSNAKLTMIGNVLLYYKFLMDDSQEVLAEDPVRWVKSDFRKQKINHTRTVATTTTTPPVFTDIATTTTTTVSCKKNLSNKKVKITTKNSNLNIYTAVSLNLYAVAADQYDNDLAFTDPEMVLNEKDNSILSAIGDDEIDMGVILDIVSNKNTVSVEVIATDNVEIDITKFLRSTGCVPITTTTTTTVFVSNKDIVLNLYVVDADADDDIDNAKSPPECKNSIGDLDGIEDEDYQVKGKYGLIYDRSDAINPPPLPPESPAYAINIQCIHPNIKRWGDSIATANQFGISSETI